MDWDEVRDYFPASKKYVYLNSAGAPPISTLAYEGGKGFYEDMYHEGDFPWSKWLKKGEETRGQLAKRLNAKPEEIAFITTTSQGINLIAQILKSLSKDGGVVTMADEFPASTLGWVQQGYDVTFVESRADCVIDLEDIKAKVTPETKIIVTSAVQYCTGFRQDLEKLGNFCKENGLIFVVDGTQGMFLCPMDVRKFNIDFLVFSGYKSLAGYGIGGLYINEKYLDTDKYPIAGWWSVENPQGMENQKVTMKKTAACLELGCPNVAGILSLSGALTLFEKMKNTEARILELTNYLIEKCEENGIGIASSKEEWCRSLIVVLAIENCGDLVQKLEDDGIAVSARKAGMRVSVQVYNNFEDIDKFINALTKLL